MTAGKLCRSGLFLGVACAAIAGVSTLLAVKATPEALGGADRYLTHVSTDKPVYRIGEKVYVRGVILRADTRAPLPEKQLPTPLVEIRGPKGDVVASGWVSTRESVLGFAWEVPKEQPGGEYTAKVTYPGEGYPPAERKFDIRAYRAPRLKSQIVFLRDGYGPGDEVSASVHVERAEGGVPAGAAVTVTARVDGQEVHRGDATIDARGNCSASFKLPDEIARGEGTLVFSIEDGGVVEPATKTIPILLQTVDLQLYPESGDLVAGLPARVYVEARTPAKKPADIAGVIVDAQGNEVTTFRTEHEGRGRFAFTPRKGGAYTLKITEPAGIRTTYALPETKDAGGVIRSLVDVVGKDEPVRLKVGASAGGQLTLTLSRREVELASARFDAPAGTMSEVTLTPPSTADGVLIATLWDAEGRPLAERLIFRRPAKSMNVTITADKDRYVPGDTVSLNIETTDDAGKPVSGVVGVTVTDDSVLEMIEKREQAPRLPVMVLLESDVRELADAHVYLDPENEKGSLATDLLLGTQGWRRLAFVETETFLKSHGDAARRVLALLLPDRRRWLRAGRAAGGGGAPEGEMFFAEGAALDGAPPAPLMLALEPAGAIPAPEFAEGRERFGKEAEVAERADLALKPAARPAVASPPPNELGVKANNEARDRLEQIAGDEVEAGVPIVAARPQWIRGQAAVQNSFAAVRVYAHELRPNRQPADRVDFTETLYWNAGIATDATTGKASVSFALSDAVTAFRVLADAFGADGALGAGTTTVESVEPFYIEPKLPLEVTQGDVIRIPVGAVNGASQDLRAVTITATGPDGLTIVQPKGFELAADQRARAMLEVTVGSNTPADFVVTAKAGPFGDRVTRPLSIKPLGFPRQIAFGGTLSAESPLVKTFEIPASLVAGSITGDVAVYPTPLANMTEALEGLIREPSGCFEQASSTVYPLVMAQQYFMSHTGVEPALIARSAEKLDNGYAKLAAYECQQKGYEWFGADPGHEALTAYGIMEFADLAKVREVNLPMVARTRKWLLDRRDGKGGFKLDSKALDSFGRAPADTTAAYIVWSLLETGEKELKTELAALRTSAQASNDSYVVALAANALSIAGEDQAAGLLRAKLARKQETNGCVEGGATSITCSGGDALKIETTALAVLAWLRDPAFAMNVENGVKYLADCCKGGRFGSTQSTILALKAIVAYDAARARPKAGGSVQLLVDGKSVGEPVAFDKDTQGAIKLPDFASTLSAGKHTLELRMQGGSDMPCSMTVNYYDVKPSSAPECKVDIGVKLVNTEVNEGEVTEADVTVRNRTDEGVPMVVAIVGLPGGLEPRHDQLKELVKSGKVAAYEVIGREVVLYWRQLTPKQEIRVPVSLVAGVPGTYTAPASRAYLYYTDEFKHWQAGSKVTIRPKG